MNESLRSILLGTAGLGAVGAVAVFLTIARGRVDAGAVELRSAVRLAAIAVLLQSAHFGEELATGFHQRFPEMLGLTPWSSRFFVAFNLSWLAIWTLGIWGLALRRQLALFPIWFLAIAGFVNGIAHPLLSVRAGGYFPGLFTSPLVGVAGFLLLRRLFLITGSSMPDK